MHRHTPLIRSDELSAQHGKNIYLKLDNLQPAGSFKIRGMGHLVKTCKEAGFSAFMGASGGNAGIALSYAGKALDMPVHVYIPVTTPKMAIEKYNLYGSEVTQEGPTLDCSKALARAEAAKDPEHYKFVSPFDDELLWEGHSSLVEEIKKDGVTPDLVICSMGGGGLYNGIRLGLERHFPEISKDFPIITVETDGTASLKASLEADNLVQIPPVPSIATSLNCRLVSAKTFELAKTTPTLNVTVSDKDCLETMGKFLDMHRFLVEPACAASLSTVMLEGALDKVMSENSAFFANRQIKNIVVVVCGGNLVNRQLFDKWRADAGLTD